MQTIKNPAYVPLGRFEIATEDILLKGEPYRITRLTDFDELFERMITENADGTDNDDSIPYWMEIGPASIALAEFIMENKEMVEKKKVLELGCGLGIPGIVAARCGAKITFSDLHPDALYFARINAVANKVTTAKYKTEDWRKTSPVHEYEVLLASDVSYERTAFPFLIKAFKNMLIPKGLVILSEPGRQYARSFFNLLANNGFRCICHQKREIVRNGSPTNVNLLVFSRVN